MNDIDFLYEEVRESVSLMEDYVNARSSAERLIKSAALREHSDVTIELARESARKAKSSLAQKYASIQRNIRKIFGKNDKYKEPSIGDHPVYGPMLSGTTDTLFAPVTTMFMDIEGSTILGATHGPEKTYIIKNSVIQLAIGAVNAFDGHVHRIMGDAVMAFFGDEMDPEQGVLNAVNCASMIMSLKSVALNDASVRIRDIASEVGIRIGLEHGGKKDVMWSSYGFPKSEEITATSFYVDRASKLQHLASKNGIMIGTVARNILDFPGIYAVRDESTLFSNEGGVVQGQHYGYAISTKEYLGCTPLSNQNKNCPIEVSARVDSIPYYQSATVLDKYKTIYFRINVKLMLPFKVEIYVKNHGKEAIQAKQHELSLRETIHVREPMDRNIEHEESTKYRGLHHLIIKVTKDKKSHTKIFGVTIR